MLKLAQTDRQTDRPTNQPTDRAKTIFSMKSAKALPRYGSRHKSAGRPAGWTDNAKTISLRLWRGMINLWSRKFAPTPGGQAFLLLTSLYGDWSTKVILTVFTKFHKANIGILPLTLTSR
ncbi:hypothetical protein DPMN_085356 [Dreissena polymorpha]|uniref:Uncharacterized protein n=1 Tax=Dreissena polymorpha TaxID=45954 RepID=A0A9D3YEW3_DREPO|nr:hypothetical protein DPMN_085356 [Dreissena polymorpha]